MAKSIEELIGYETLTRAIQDPANGLPTTALPAGFFTLTTPVEGFHSHFLKTASTRKTATISAYGAPSRPANHESEVEVPITLIHSIEHQTHGPEILSKLLDTGSAVKQMKAAAIIGQRQANFRQRFANLRTAAVYSALALAKIHFDGVGNLLPSSSGAKISVDFGTSANNLNNTGIGAWNTTSTDVAGQIIDEKERMEKTTGLTFSHCLYGSNILQYLALNDSLKNLINGNQGFAAGFIANEIPAGFLGMTWWRSNRMWFQDQNGTNQDFFGDNSVVFFPDPSPAWYELQEGSYVVPTNLGALYNDSTGALGSLAEVQGMFAYAKVSDNPVGIQHIMGDTFLPVVKIPDCLRIVTDVTSAAT